MIKWSTAVRKGPRAFPQARLHVAHGGFKGLDLAEVQLEHEAVMSGDPAVKGGRELSARRSNFVIGQCGQTRRISLARHEGGEDRAAAHAAEVSKDAGEFAVGRFEGFLQAQGVLSDFPHELFTGPGEIAQLLNGRRGHETAADQPMAQEVSDPGGVIDVTLAPRDVADVHGIGEHQLERAVEHGPHGLPEDAGRLHGDVGAAVGREPIAQRKQIRCAGAERADFVGNRLAGAEAHTSDDALLMHVQPGTLRVNDVHSHHRAEMASAWSPRQRSLEGALSGSSPVAAVRGARGAPGPTTIRALRTNAGPTSVPTPRAHSTSFHPPRVRHAGEQLQ